MKKPATNPRLAVARKLAVLADALERGGSFPITRLTVLKRLCAAWENAAPFACYLADLSQKRFRATPPSRLDSERIEEFGARIDAAVACIHGYGAAPTPDAHLALRTARAGRWSARRTRPATRGGPRYAPFTAATRGWWRTRPAASSIR